MANTKKSNKLTLGIAVVLILMTFFVSSCNPQYTSATGVVTEVIMATSVDKENRPVNPTNVFPTDAAGFYCSFKMSGFPVGAKGEVKWIYVGGDPKTENVTGKEFPAETQAFTVQQLGQGYTYAVYSNYGVPGYKWPRGQYRVDIYVDGMKKGSTLFMIE